jgi:hypothetical protein
VVDRLVPAERFLPKGSYHNLAMNSWSILGLPFKLLLLLDLKVQRSNSHVTKLKAYNCAGFDDASLNCSS